MEPYLMMLCDETWSRCRLMQQMYQAIDKDESSSTAMRDRLSEDGRDWLRQQLAEPLFAETVTSWSEKANDCASKAMKQLLTLALNPEADPLQVAMWRNLEKKAFMLCKGMRTFLYEVELWAVLVTRVGARRFFYRWVEEPVLRMYWEVALPLVATAATDYHPPNDPMSSVAKDCVQTLCEVADFFCTGLLSAVRRKFFALRRVWNTDFPQCCETGLRLRSLSWCFTAEMRRESEVNRLCTMGHLRMGLSKVAQRWRLVNYFDGGYESGINRSTYLQRGFGEAAVQCIRQQVGLAPPTTCCVEASVKVGLGAVHEWLRAYWLERVNLGRCFRRLSVAAAAARGAVQGPMASSRQDRVRLRFGEWNPVLSCCSVQGIEWHGVLYTATTPMSTSHFTVCDKNSGDLIGKRARSDDDDNVNVEVTEQDSVAKEEVDTVSAITPTTTTRLIVKIARPSSAAVVAVAAAPVKVKETVKIPTMAQWTKLLKKANRANAARNR